MPKPHDNQFGFVYAPLRKLIAESRAVQQEFSEQKYKKTVARFRKIFGMRRDLAHQAAFLSARPMSSLADDPSWVRRVR